MNGNVGTFQRAVDMHESYADFCALYADLDLPPATLRKLYDRLKTNALYLSEHYQVAIDKDVEHGFAGLLFWHLSIKRIDKEPIMDWRDLQAIKNQLCGPECEALQLFPAESRCVDTSNQYHLWVVMKGPTGRQPKLPIGWFTRMTTDTPGANAKQRARTP